jgi:hypothetical protein
MQYLKYFFCVSVVLFCGIAAAQSISLPDTGTGSGSSSGSSSGTGTTTSGSGFSDIGTAGTSAASDVSRFEGVSEIDFVGIKDGAPFVGREKPFETSRSTRTSNVRSSSTGTRRTTSARTTSASRTSAGSRLSTSSSQYSVRSAAAADFKYLPLSTEQRAADFSSQLKRIPNLPFDAGKIQTDIKTTKAGSTAVVNGMVASEHDKKIVKQLLLLEPGIDSVDNKITVVKVPEL